MTNFTVLRVGCLWSNKAVFFPHPSIFFFLFSNTGGSLLDKPMGMSNFLRHMGWNWRVNWIESWILPHRFVFFTTFTHLSTLSKWTSSIVKESFEQMVSLCRVLPVSTFALHVKPVSTDVDSWQTIISLGKTWEKKKKIQGEAHCHLPRSYLWLSQGAWSYKISKIQLL